MEESRKPKTERDEREKEGTKKISRKKEREREREKRQKKERSLKPKSIRGALVKYRTAWLKEEEEEQRKSFDDDDDDELCRNERVSPRFGAFEKRRQTGAPVGRDDVFFFFVNKRSQSRRRRPSVVFGFETEREISMPFFTAFRQHSFL